MNSIMKGVMLLVVSCLMVNGAAGQQPAPRRSIQSPGSKPYQEALRRYKRKEEPKIVGGKIAANGAYPWQVSISAAEIPDPYYSHFCGGTVHSAQWIVTAAHCVEGNTPEQLMVVTGTNKLAPNITRRAVRRIIIQPSWAPKNYDNDIALLELAQPLTLDARTRAVPLLSESEEAGRLKDGTVLTVVGWGRTAEGGSKVRDLRYVNIPFVDRSLCNKAYAYNGRVTDSMICAGVRTGGKDSCQGDSGGPLTATTNDGVVLAGVVSWGEGCARPNKVGVYTRVAKFNNWVAACVTGTPECAPPTPAATSSKRDDQ